MLGPRRPVARPLNAKVARAFLAVAERNMIALGDSPQKKFRSEVPVIGACDMFGDGGTPTIKRRWCKYWQHRKIPWQQ